ncbi:AP-1 complex subunit mu-1-I [Wickerhamomyces ciferrii]|uniref:AP-1 complex subunit mu-1-I n=1 Tax=Wickerhamomyces ciferrii (strain ATCC 14091 / BCRC 22168 / CBS 111 / JCM 3599 / NBRC 0793 / NRRL Y-1031 F-60-10) TaxID=1206466 RepID=K0KWY9_WICCF|nr:AP-1 complex subunit mu-1-I [Wickerhamomyces ciferrii]CCH46004.1 AP-1 complex subunit mu-1-I [Wickerhamomyces ciferrii]
MASALAILDSNAYPLISRVYTTDILPLDIIFQDFQKLIQDDNTNYTPIIKSPNGVNYIYIQSNDIILMIITYYDYINSMTLVQFLYNFKDILLRYFKTSNLFKDQIKDNFNLIYEIMDEIMDFGIPQFTDFNILQDFIKIDVNQSIEKKDKDIDDSINSSIIRTTTSNISWRPKGIYYTKNEIFIDLVERLNIIINPDQKIIKNEIKGEFQCKSYLSGIPTLKISLNKFYDLKKFKFHQCVDLNKFINDQVLEFIPPDGDFILGSYQFQFKSNTTPILEITHIDYLPKPPHNIILKFGIKINASPKTLLNNIKILIPIDFKQFPKEIDKSETPKFKTSIGKIYYKLDQDCLIWEIDSLGGDRHFEMMSMFKLQTEEVKELGMDPPPKSTTPNILKLQKNLEIKKIKNIDISFEIKDLTISGLKIEYLKILESNLNYPWFPWVRYKTLTDEYIYRL